MSFYGFRIVLIVCVSAIFRLYPLLPVDNYYMEESKVPEKKQKATLSHWQLSHNPWALFEIQQ